MIATLPAEAEQEAVAVIASAFSMVFYTVAGPLALGLVCALTMKNVKLESYGGGKGLQDKPVLAD